MRRYVTDAVMGAVLTAAALVARRDVLPREGLGHDDAWVALGATRGSMRNLLTVSVDHPGFTLGLRAFSHIVGGPTQRLAYPALIIGVLLPAVLYYALRRFRYERSICTLLAAAAVGVPIAIASSGRVKTYVLDAIIVLGITAIVPRLVGMRWRWSTSVVAVVVGAAVSSVSVFALVSTVTAFGFVALESRRDRVLRVTTALTMIVFDGIFLIAVQRTYNGRVLERYWTGVADAYVGFSANPFRLGGSIVQHVLRTGPAFPGGPSVLAGTAAAVAVAGIIVAAASRHHSSQQLRARYVGLLLFLVLIGSIARKFVFGPTRAGLRVSLWMLPILAFGLAITLHSARGLPNRRTATQAVDGIMYAVALGVLVSAVSATPIRYPTSGARSATRYVESNLGVHDVVLIIGTGVYAYTVDSSLHVRLIATPKEIIGFAPVVDDPRVHSINFTPSPRELPAADHVIKTSIGARTERVFVYEVALPNSPKALNAHLHVRLMGLGFTESARTFDSVHVQVWVRTRKRL
jgi:hypothetical protein